MRNPDSWRPHERGSFCQFCSVVKRVQYERTFSTGNSINCWRALLVVRVYICLFLLVKFRDIVTEFFWV